MDGRRRTGPFDSLRRRGDRSRGDPLSEITRADDPGRGPLDDFVASLVDAACAGAEEKSALDLVVLDLRELVNSFDVLVICSGRNDRQVRSIVEEIERVVTREVGVRPLRVEGLAEGQWVAMDFGDVIVHVFDEETRSYYDLEHLWNAAAVLRPLRT